MAQPNLQFVAVEQRSRQSCLNVLHSFRLELILGLELFSRLAVRRSLALLHRKTVVMILSQQITYELLPPAVPECQQRLHDNESSSNEALTQLSDLQAH